MSYPEDLASPLVVVAAALRRDDGRILVQRRPAGGPLPGLWEFAGGKVEPGEAPAAALARELREELGIIVDPGDAIPATFAIGTIDERALVLLLFEVSRWAGTPSALHAAAIDWLLPAAMGGLAMPPADRPLVAWLIARG